MEGGGLNLRIVDQRNFGRHLHGARQTVARLLRVGGEGRGGGWMAKVLSGTFAICSRRPKMLPTRTNHLTVQEAAISARESRCRRALPLPPLLTPSHHIPRIITSHCTNVPKVWQSSCWTSSSVYYSRPYADSNFVMRLVGSEATGDGLAGRLNQVFARVRSFAVPTHLLAEF